MRTGRSRCICANGASKAEGSWGEYETLADGSGFAVTDEWSTCSKVVVNHPLTRPDGTVMPGISRLRRFDWKVGPDEGLHADDYEI